MRLLLDTHAVIWWFIGNPRLPASIRELIYANAGEVFISAASAFEVALKVRRGGLPEAERLSRHFQEMSDDEGFHSLSVTVEHALKAGSLPIEHRDPFDRLLIAQAITENMALVSNESLFDASGVNRLW